MVTYSAIGSCIFIDFAKAQRPGFTQIAPKPVENHCAEARAGRCEHPGICGPLREIATTDSTSAGNLGPNPSYELIRRSGLHQDEGRAGDQVMRLPERVN